MSPDNDQSILDNFRGTPEEFVNLVNELYPRGASLPEDIQTRFDKAWEIIEVDGIQTLKNEGKI